MPIHDLLARCRPGLRPGAFLLGMALAVAAYATAMLLVGGLSLGYDWLPVLVAALGAAGACGVAERSASGGLWTATASLLATTAGFGLGLGLLVVALPAQWVPTSLQAFAEALPIHVTPTTHELADGRQVYGAYLLAGGMVALAGCLLSRPGMLVVVCCHVLGWAVLLGYPASSMGDLPERAMAVVRAVGAALPFLLLALVGLVALGTGVAEATRRLFGRRGEGTTSLREPGLTAAVGVLLLLVAGSVELFGGGMLARLLEG